MASKTYSLRALVLRRTKLGESDVICTLLAEDGSQVRAIAKGARKPSSPFSSRLEVYAVCDLLLSQGRSLDIVKEARLIQGNAHLRSDISLMQAAAPIVELLDRASQDGLQDTRLFPMACAALSAFEGAQCPCSLITSAELLKTLAVLGFRPRVELCVACGKPLQLMEGPRQVPFSVLDGGALCSDCSARFDTMFYDRDLLAWVHSLLFSTFDQIVQFSPDDRTCLELMRFLQVWIRQHLGLRLKSLDFLISSPL